MHVFSICQGSSDNFEHPNVCAVCMGCNVLGGNIQIHPGEKWRCVCSGMKSQCDLFYLQVDSILKFKCDSDALIFSQIGHELSDLH
jgi:hypothetical protein